MKYEYIVEEECFRRVDKRGRPLNFNITEAKRIKTLRDLGYSIQGIYDKMDFANDVTITNVRTFVNNLESDNICLDGDYPAPTKLFEEVDNDSRITELERRVSAIETQLNAPHECACESEDKGEISWLAKLKKW